MMEKPVREKYLKLFVSIKKKVYRILPQGPYLGQFIFIVIYNMIQLARMLHRTKLERLVRDMHSGSFQAIVSYEKY
jgi:hypothetical protein